MAFFNRYKNDDDKFVALRTYYDDMSALLSSDRYISRKAFSKKLETAIQSYKTLKVLQENDSLEHYCKTTKSSLKDMEKYMAFLSKTEDMVKKHNRDFIEKHLVSDKPYLDDILKADDPKISLDEDQRRVVLSDEDYTLVIAGAGAGKTTTLEAKAKYLVEKKHVDPSRILVISFTRKATEELRERFDRISVHARISTFHGIGNAIIHSESGKKNIKGPGFLFETLKKYLIERMEDASFMRKINLFFASYLETPFDSDKSVELYKLNLAHGDYSTLKSELDEYQETLAKKKITIRSERVRSFQECQIANFLFVNGIDYEYEPIYPYCIPGSQKPYTPDFRITQGDKVFYLEHYGINEDGTNWRFSAEELELYKKHMKDKEILHRKHKTNLICTYSNYNDRKSLISHLSMLLKENGIQLHQREDKEIYHEIATRAQERYFIKLIQLLSNFINRFKTNHYGLEKFSEFSSFARENGDERTLLFLEIARQCYTHYGAALRENKAIDFEDMINEASDILEERIQKSMMLPYDYIFIDEYQDISFQRFNLAEKLSKCSHAKILAVGDDWQSIYRFSGADITLFTDFEKRMGYGEILYLRSTHRNSQELIDMAGDFIMTNDLQKKKSLISDRHLEDPVIIYSYKDDYSYKEVKEHPELSSYAQLGKAIEKALEHIHDKFGDDSSTLLLGRYNFDGERLNMLPDLFLYTKDSRVKCKKYPKMKIRFMTAHSSKGLGADNVILINGKDDILGFPSKIEDDPVMKLVLKNAKEIDFAEERRLFYVALTRTKNRVYLIAPKSKPSLFITEMKEKYTNIILNGPQLEKRVGPDFRYKCPRCGYPLQVRSKALKKGAERETKLYICSNDPEVCGFVTNDVFGGNLSIQKCPSCEDGYLVVKKVKRDSQNEKFILGCSNYKKDGSGCNYVINPENFSSDWEKTCRKYANYQQGQEKLPIEKCVLLGYPVMDLLKIIRYVTGTLTEKTGFHFNRYSLKKFLLGEEEKSFQLYHINEDKAYGRIEKDKENFILPLLEALIQMGFLLVIEDPYQNLEYSKMEIDESFSRKVFELFVS